MKAFKIGLKLEMNSWWLELFLTATREVPEQKTTCGELPNAGTAPDAHRSQWYIEKSLSVTASHRLVVGALCSSSNSKKIQKLRVTLNNHAAWQRSDLFFSRAALLLQTGTVVGSVTPRSLAN